MTRVDTDSYGQVTCFSKIAFSLFASIRRYLLGFWDAESLQCLVQSKIEQYNLNDLIEDGYGDQLIASVIMPRAAVLRIFPYVAPLSLFIQQMSTTPTCFLVPCWHNSSPVYETFRQSCLKNPVIEETHPVSSCYFLR